MAKRAIMVGVGGISRAWFGPLKAEGVEVAALVDLDVDRARSRATEQGLPDAVVSADLADTLKRVEADFAIDLTVPKAHCPVVCSCLEAGLPVIGEKPMAESLDECKRMVETSRRTGKLYQVSQSRRYHAIHEQIARTVATGRLGRITAVHCDFFMGCHFGGFRDEMPHVLLNDMSIHHFDLLRKFTGADATSVYAEERNPQGSWYAHGPAAVCLYELTGGAVFTYRGSWCDEGCHTSWQGNWRITGVSGTLVYENDQAPRGQIVAGNEGFNRPLADLPMEPKPEVVGGQHGALREFLAALDGGPTPQGECSDNIKSMAMVCGAVESAETGRRVALEIA